MAPDEMKALGRELAPVILRFVGEAVAPVAARMTALETRPPRDGLAVVGRIKSEAGVVFLTLNNGEIIRDERKETEEAPEGLAALVKAEIDRALAAHSAAADRGGPDVAEIVRLVEAAVDKAIAELKPGRDGRDGAPGAPGPPGRDGKDGKDGLGFDDMSAELAEDGRTMILSWQRGEDVKEQRLTPAIPLDRGVWRPGTFQRGDGVTWGGSFWIAQRDTEDKPETSDAWRLAVKRGRDGRNGKVPE